MSSDAVEIKASGDGVEVSVRTTESEISKFAEEYRAAKEEELKDVTWRFVISLVAFLAWMGALTMTFATARNTIEALSLCALFSGAILLQSIADKRPKK